MRNVLALAALCAALLASPAYAQKGKPAAKSTPKATVLKTETDSLSYAIGAMIGRNLDQQEMKLDAAVIGAAIADVLGKRDLVMTDAQIEATMNALQQRMAAGQVSKLQEQAAANKAAGEAFLAQNRTKQGVIVLPSGLQYEVITEGTGVKPKPSDKVTTHYKGTLLDGTTFDSSYERGEPVSFQLDQVIKGWTEGLQLMSEGSKYRLFIPSHLAYGEGGAPGSPIGPNSTLVFEVELIKVN